MAVLNSSTIGILQSRTLEERVNSSSNVVDLSWVGFDRTSDRPFVRKKKFAHINRVLLWLSSKHDDYVRESFKGGVMYSLIGQLCNDTNLEQWEGILRDRFNADFSNDLSLIYIKLTPDTEYRSLSLDMIIRDVLENQTFTVSTEIEK